MAVQLHPHARERMAERSVTETEVIATVEPGESFPAKFGRTGFRRNFQLDQTRLSQHDAIKPIEAYAV